MNRTYDDFLCRLKEQRKQLGLSQEQMAQRVHKTQSNYSKVELGLQRLSYEELKYLSESGIDIYYIFTGYRGSGKYLDFFERKTYAGDLAAILPYHFTALSAFAFMVFVLLYTPCMSAIGTIKKEFGGKFTIFSVLMQLTVAWIGAFLIFNIGSFFI